MLGFFYLEPRGFLLYMSNKEKEFSKHRLIPVRVRNTRPAIVGSNTLPNRTMESNRGLLEDKRGKVAKDLWTKCLGK